MNHYLEARGRRWRLRVWHEPQRVQKLADSRGTFVLLSTSLDDEGIIVKRFAASAFAHPKDQFSRKTGRLIAARRLLRKLSRAGWSTTEMRSVLFALCPELDPAQAPVRALREAERLLRRHGYGYHIFDPARPYDAVASARSG